MTTHGELISQMTPEEKVSLVIGADNWHTTAIERLGIPAVTMADGPNGVRKELPDGALGVSESEPATCFPPAVALGCAFDESLAEEMGQAMGDEAAAQGVDVLLAPAINIKRSPLCGRNFEYFSEDPLIAGRLGAAVIRGIQTAGVSTSLKHFAVNNQETDRLRVSADVDDRPLRELYLRGFGDAVRHAKPWTIMCAYNRVNGVFASQNDFLLTKVLRDEWGYDGVVVSDWGAVDDRAAALRAGLDLQMPGTDGYTNGLVLAALRDGTLSEATLDNSVDRVLTLVDRCQAKRGTTPAVDHHALARQIAGRCVVLLKNDGDLLPLAREASVAVIGRFAAEPRIQGAGSAQVHATRVDVPLDEIKALASSVTYAAGFGDSGDDKALRDEAVKAAKHADVAVVFLGLPAVDESEGFDRPGIGLPGGQLALLDAVRAANPKTVVVLTNGAVVALPFRDDVPAIVEAWLLGQAGGGAIADVLYGVVNPSGHLTETIPWRLEDTPSFGNFPGEFGHVRYGEGLLVGYRWYDAKGLDVAYPFGHGLSYTTFRFGDATASVSPSGDLDVTVPVTNSGRVAGRVVVQAYVGLPGSVVVRPPRELKGFASVELAPGETKPVKCAIKRADLAYWDTRVGRFVVEGGTYRLEVGASSRDIRATCTVDVAGDDVVVPLTLESTMGEALAHPVVGPMLQQLVDLIMGGPDADPNNVRMMASFPLIRLVTMPGVPVDIESVKQLVAMANGEIPLPG